MVISIIFVILGLVAMVGLPVAQFPEIVPPEIQIIHHLYGRRCGDGRAVRCHPHRAADERRGQHELHVFRQRQQRHDADLRQLRRQDRPEHGPDLHPDAAEPGPGPAPARCAQLRRDDPEIPVFAAHDPGPLLPEGTYDGTFLANYANINLIDQLLRVPGVAMVTIFGAGQYAIRIWVKPDTLAKLGITVPEIVNAVQKQNTVNPAGQIGSEPVPAGQEFTYTVRAQGRLISEEEFGQIVVRANPDGSIVRLEGRGPDRTGGADLQREEPDGRQAGRRHGHLPVARDRMPSPPSRASRS